MSCWPVSVFLPSSMPGTVPSQAFKVYIDGWGKRVLAGPAYVELEITEMDHHRNDLAAILLCLNINSLPTVQHFPPDLRWLMWLQSCGCSCCFLANSVCVDATYYLGHIKGTSCLHYQLLCLDLFVTTTIGRTYTPTKGSCIYST